MLKKTVTYKTFDDKEVTDTFYFNITRNELVGIEVGESSQQMLTAETFTDTIKKAMATNDSAKLMEIFRTVVDRAYGEKSDDGRHFRKSDEILNDFKSTMAYDEIIMELAFNEQAASAFIKGVLPKELLPQNKPPEPS